MTFNFDGCRDRLVWVDHALRVYDEEFRMWMLEHDPFPTTAEYDADSGRHDFRLGQVDPPARFGVMVGNIVHQLRATLDNVVWQLVIANGHVPKGGGGGNCFPILDRKKESSVHNVQTALRGVRDDHRDFIRALQPRETPSWDPGQHPLEQLRELSNTDKHQVLEIVRVVRSDRGPVTPPPQVRVPPGVSVIETGFEPPERRRPDAIIGWAVLEPAGRHSSAHLQLDFWAEFTLGGLPSNDLLVRLFAVVTAIFNLLEASVEHGEGLPLGLFLDPEQVAKIEEATRLFRRSV